MYFYNCYAVGTASTIPGKQFTQAVCGLSVRGGVASSRTGKFNSGGISFGSATSEVFGDEKNVNGLRVCTTKATVVLERLNVRDVLTAERVEAHVISEHRSGDFEPSTAFVGSRFDGLRIKDTAVTLDLSDDLFGRYSTHARMQADFQNAYTRDRVLKCMLGYDLRLSAGVQEDLQDAYEAFQEQRALPTLKPFVLCSFVTKVHGRASFETWGPIITIPNFGTIYLGEVMVWPWMRCLNMLRIELNREGSVLAGSAGLDGTWYP